MRRQRTAFTLIEVLVVVAIIALIVAILIPSLSRARHQARRQVCGSNLHQLGITWQMYADAHAGFFPNLPDIALGNWTLLPEQIRDGFEKGRYGLKGGSVFYCPYYEAAYGNKPSVDWYTTRVVPLGGGKNMNTYYIGYALYSYQPAAVTNITSLPKVPQYEHLRKIMPMLKNSDKFGARRPLLFDEVQYYGPSGVYGVGGFSYAAHRESGETPAGGNSVYGDGHVEWRKFKSILNRPDKVAMVDSSFMFPVRQSGSDDFIRWY